VVPLFWLTLYKEFGEDRTYSSGDKILDKQINVLIAILCSYRGLSHEAMDVFFLFMIRTA